MRFSRNTIALILFPFSLSAPLFTAQYPSSPQVPVVPEPAVEGATPAAQRNKKGKTPGKAVPLALMRLRIHLGDKKHSDCRGGIARDLFVHAQKRQYSV